LRLKVAKVPVNQRRLRYWQNIYASSVKTWLSPANQAARLAPRQSGMWFLAAMLSAMDLQWKRFSLLLRAPTILMNAFGLHSSKGRSFFAIDLSIQAVFITE